MRRCSSLSDTELTAVLNEILEKQKERIYKRGGNIWIKIRR
jgi:hypothetical protein